MNDFTKEELHSILEGFRYIKDDPAWRNTEGWDDELQKKIQSMINNYCEHTNIVTGAYSRSNPPKKCDACGVLYYDNQKINLLLHRT